MKSKQELLLHIALDCVCHGEHADFEFREIITNGDFIEAVEEFYFMPYPLTDGYEELFENPDDLQVACDKWYQLLEIVQQDAANLLKSLIEHHQ